MRWRILAGAAFVLGMMWGFGRGPNPTFPEPVQYNFENVNYDEPTLPEAPVTRLPDFDPLNLPPQIPVVETITVAAGEPYALEGTLHGFEHPGFDKGWYWSTLFIVEGPEYMQPNPITGDSFQMKSLERVHRLEGFAPSVPGRYRFWVTVRHPRSGADLLQENWRAQYVRTRMCEGEMVVTPAAADDASAAPPSGG
jgi:hypothetical protein